EKIIIHQNDRPHVIGSPTFLSADVDSDFEFEGTLKLVQIIKSVQNAVYNTHDYVFKVVSIDKLKKEE
ncbi:hypothetical protein LCGC14_2550150, partial [marine sediment metagenome]